MNQNPYNQYPQFQPQPGMPPQQQMAPQGYPPPQQQAAYQQPLPQQQMAYPQQPQPYPPGFGPPPAQQALPQVHVVTAATVSAAQAAKEKMPAQGGSGGKARRWSPPGPGGSAKWNGAPVGFVSKTNLWLCPPAKENADLWAMYSFHSGSFGAEFSSVTCPGETACPLCLARSSMMRQNIDGWKDLRTRTKLILNVIPVDYPNAVFDPTVNAMRAMQWEAPPAFLDFMVDTMNRRKPDGEPLINELIHPQRGRVLEVTKKKTGPMDMNVEWSFAWSLESAPLAPQYWPALSALPDLAQFIYPCTRPQMTKVMQSLRVNPTPEIMHLLMQLPDTQSHGASQQQGPMTSPAAVPMYGGGQFQPPMQQQPPYQMQQPVYNMQPPQQQMYQGQPQQAPLQYAVPPQPGQQQGLPQGADQLRQQVRGG